MLITVSAKRRNRDQGKNKCQTFDFQEDFDVTRYMGRWYEIMSYPFCLTTNAKCVVSTYAFGSDRNISMYSRFVNSQGFENRIMGMAAEKAPGVLAVMFSAARKFLKILSFQSFNFFPFSAEASSFYNILSTDYKNYAVVAACNSYCGSIEGFNVWVLSRKPNLGSEFNDEILKVLKDNEISPSYLQRTVQNCNFSLMF